MVLIFDLDDTLYDEISFVKSGFKAVSKWSEEKYGLNSAASYESMINILEKEGRGKIFNRWLEQNEITKKSVIKEALHIYRHHKPNISLDSSTINLLHELQQFSLYIVTDGHKIVQKNKVEALQINSIFKRVFITHRFGIANAKPSIYCFDRIRIKEKCSWNEMIYVGDNPFKDFVNLNPLGVQTIRVFTGCYKSVIAKDGFDAKYQIPDLNNLKIVLKKIDNEHKN